VANIFSHGGYRFFFPSLFPLPQLLLVLVVVEDTPPTRSMNLSLLGCCLWGGNEKLFRYAFFLLLLLFPSLLFIPHRQHKRTMVVKVNEILRKRQHDDNICK